MSDSKFIVMSNRNIIVMLLVIAGLVFGYKKFEKSQEELNHQILVGKNFEVVPVMTGDRWVVSTSGYMPELGIFQVTTTNTVGKALSGFCKTPISPGAEVKFEEYQYCPHVDVGKCKIYIASKKH